MLLLTVVISGKRSFPARDVGFAGVLILSAMLEASEQLFAITERFLRDIGGMLCSIYRTMRNVFYEEITEGVRFELALLNNA